MKSIIPTKLKKKKRQRSLASQKRNRHRNLRLESLEDRRMLAFGDTLISVAGQEFDPVLNPVDPPDTDGAAGLNYYVQSVNSTNGASITIFNKSDGSVATAPFPISQFANPGSACNTAGGDGVVQFDQLAQRWVILEFTPPGVNTLCTYVSQTSDPTAGQWFAYENTVSNFPDYPKLSVWPDGYYVSTNEQPGIPSPGAYVLDRENMLQGLPARPIQRFTTNALPFQGFQALASTTVQGPAPAAGTPNFFMRQIDDEGFGVGNPLFDSLEIYEYRTDFNNPVNSSFQLAQTVQIAEFDGDLCAFGGNLNCVAQPGTTVGLDAIAGILMNRLQYRNFTTHESIVGTFTVDVNGLDLAGIRWFELRRNAGSNVWNVFQEGLVSPGDGNARFMGAIAMNGDGDIMLGYNVSGPATFPGIRYVGRQVDDPLGVMTLPETNLVTGQGSKITGSRYGDYQSMTVDPVDDSTFWFTGEYIDIVGEWATQVASIDGSPIGPVVPPPPPPPDSVPNDGSSVAGVVYDDLDGDGGRTTGEPGVEGVYVFADLNGNRVADVTEPADVTNDRGEYRIDLPSAGTFDIRQVIPPGWQQTEPAVGAKNVTVPVDTMLVAVDFGLMGLASPTQDYGDAPFPYPVTVAENGARHAVLPGFGLGSGSPDGESVPVRNTEATGDDLTNAADEDGAVFSDLFTDSTATVPITVSTGDFAPGLLQVFVDHNQDGDWNDFGEWVVRNMRLGDGTHHVPINIPGDAETGMTYVRLRYGPETNLGPKGPSQWGEVEDHLVRVLGGDPVAVDDGFTVPQDSNNNDLDVLANDLPSKSGGTRITAVGLTTLVGGSVVIAPDELSVIYTPPAGQSGVDSFTYTLEDADGNTDTANVTVNISPTIQMPVALDDFFNATAGQNPQDVLANDLPGINPPIRINTITQPPNGVVVVAPDGLSLQYTPTNPVFNGLDQYTYTVIDQNNNVSAPATVSVIVDLDPNNPPSPDDNDLVAFIPTVTKLDGSPTTSVNIGETFLVHVAADDLRLSDPNTSTPEDDRGVFAAYMDVLFEGNLVRILSIQHSADYQLQATGDISTPGVVDDAGAGQTGDMALGPDPKRVFTLTVQAIQPGTVTFQTDPTEVSPFFDTLLFEPPQPKVPLDQIRYGATSVDISGSGGPGAPDAVDDIFPMGTTSLTVLDNDVPGDNGTTSIISTGVISPANGSTVQIVDGQSLLYSPGNPNDTVQFTYTIEDGIGNRDTATVTIQGTADDDIVRFSVMAKDLDGNPISTIAPGTPFVLDAYAKDLRPSDPNPETPQDEGGLFAAYFDLLFNNLVSVAPGTSTPAGLNFDIDFSFDPNTLGNVGQFQNGISGTVKPNNIDEVGGFLTMPLSPTGLGTDPLGFRVFSVGMIAGQTPGTVTFSTDPAELEPNSNVFLFSPTDRVLPPQIDFGSTTLTIENGGGGEGEFTNPANNYDVDADGFVAASDVLGVVYDINTYGARALVGGGEGEGSGGLQMFLDVNSDLFVSSIDVLMVVSYINSLVPAQAEGEGAVLGADDFGDSAAAVDQLLIDQEGLTTPLTDDVDTVFATAADDEPTISTSSSNSSSSSSSSDDSLDALLSTDLLDDVLKGWST